MGTQLGMRAHLYYKVGGVSGGGAWVEATNVRDLDWNLETAETDVTTRGNNGWRATEPTLSEGTVEFEMVWDNVDPAFNAFRAAYFARSAIGLRVFDAEGQGLEADFKITNLSRSEPLEEAITASLTLKIAYSETPPTYVE